MSRFSYEVTEMVLEMWDNDNPNEENAPFLRQPHWPDGTPWGDEAEITAWADAAIVAFLDPNSEFVAGPNPDNPVIPRPQPDPEEQDPTKP